MRIRFSLPATSRMDIIRVQDLLSQKAARVVKHSREHSRRLGARGNACSPPVQRFLQERAYAGGCVCSL